MIEILFAITLGALIGIAAVAVVAVLWQAARELWFRLFWLNITS